ncbi:hypothetical protein EFS06_11100 [Levilactobacillus brevis]|nr:hypothetical protein [Levilactobacillus brevis]
MVFNLEKNSCRLVSGHTDHSLSIGFGRLDCTQGGMLFFGFYKKGVDGFYPSTPNIIEPN